MKLIGFLGTLLVLAGLYWWFALPRLRKFDWWAGFHQGVYARLCGHQGVQARLRAICVKLWAVLGNSRTIAIGMAAELLGLLDELKLLDWSQWVGSDNAGRVMVAMGVVMIVLRFVTRTAVSFSSEERAAK